MSATQQGLNAIPIKASTQREALSAFLGGDRSILLSYGTIWLKPFIFKAVSVSDDDIFITISANIGVIFVLASC